MSKLIMMIGVPGSGKSTWVQNHKTEEMLWISRDKIRFDKLKEGEDYFAHETEVFNQFIEEIAWGLKMDKTVIADATHLSRKSRASVLDKVRKFADTIEAVWIDTDIETAFKQNDMREGRAWVKHGIIRRMWFSLEEPTAKEGFNKITIIQEGKECAVQ